MMTSTAITETSYFPGLRPSVPLFGMEDAPFTTIIFGSSRCIAQTICLATTYYLYLLDKTAEIKAAGHGISMVHMTKEKMEKLEVPLPPLAEQQRIVAKVNELMAICDQLEAQITATEQDSRRFLESVLADALAPGIDLSAGAQVA
jgi:hypothetical protein